MEKLQQQYAHEMPRRPQHSPYRVPPKIYGAAAQDTTPDDETAKIDDKRVKVVQQVAGGVLYYGRVLDNTVLPGLSSITSEQDIATETTKKKYNNRIH